MFETVIGLEIHVQLSTQSKAFCGDSAAFGAGPNEHISAISLGLPGTLPRANRQQVMFATRLGLALGCRINQTNAFDRKNYFYADSPKGYQITQDRLPICVGGGLEINTKSGKKHIRLHHIHMEEDAGKSIHDQHPRYSLVDLNRAGVPLLEIVTEPDLRSAEEVDALMTAMRRLVRWLEVSDGNMEEGSLRCDCNVSIRPEGSEELFQRCEIKNMNSMRYARRAIDYEVQRQSNIVKKGGTVAQETLNFDPVSGTTSPLRSKEDANDYRYFPEPDLPLVLISDAELAAIEAELPMLPSAYQALFINEYQLSEYDAALLSDERNVATYFKNICQKTPHYKAAANLMINKILPYINEQHISLDALPIGMDALVGFLELIQSNQVSNTAAYQRLFPAMLEQPQATPLALAQSLNLIQVSDSSFLDGLIDEVLAAYPDKVIEYQKGKKGLLGLFVGEVMKRSKGKADPKALNTMVQNRLAK